MNFYRIQATALEENPFVLFSPKNFYSPPEKLNFTKTTHTVAGGIYIFQGDMHGNNHGANPYP